MYVYTYIYLYIYIHMYTYTILWSAPWLRAIFRSPNNAGRKAPGVGHSRLESGEKDTKSCRRPPGTTY